MSGRRTFRDIYGRPKFLVVPSMSIRKITVPQRTQHFTPAERAFARAIPIHAKAIEKYKAFLTIYRLAAKAVYDAYNIPMNVRSPFYIYGNAQLERHLNTRRVYERNTPEKRRFKWIAKHLAKLESNLRASAHIYKTAARALRQEYHMAPYNFWNMNKNYTLEEEYFQNKAASVIQSQVRRKITTKSLKTFSREMNKRKFPQNLTEKIMRTSLNRRR